MQEAKRGELENCRQCGGQMCLRPDRVCCSVCGLIAPAGKAESPAPRAVAKMSEDRGPVAQATIPHGGNSNQRRK